MTAQCSIFDPPVRSSALAERVARDEGMAYAAAAAPDKGYGPERIEEMRQYARWFCHANRSRVELSLDDQKRLRQADNVVWMDVVREKFNIRPITSRDHNWLGGFFKDDKRFEATGDTVHSRTAGSHGNPVMLWRLKQEANHG